MKYPGIKEDVYVPRFQPDSSINDQLNLKKDDLVVTLRPPANEAHYHNPESETLLEAVLECLGKRPNTKIILLPRNHRQEVSIRKSWAHLFDSGEMMVPPSAVDGLNLIWHSDLVISGGGTMNREAAALGVPVYSIFRGKIGAVDRYLADVGRLVLIESAEEVRTKLVLQRRSRGGRIGDRSDEALKKIVNNVVSALESVSQNSLKKRNVAV
jgi:predicted glycosyltransferase